MELRLTPTLKSTTLSMTLLTTVPSIAFPPLVMAPIDPSPLISILQLESEAALLQSKVNVLVFDACDRSKLECDSSGTGDSGGEVMSGLSLVLAPGIRLQNGDTVAAPAVTRLPSLLFGDG